MRPAEERQDCIDGEKGCIFGLQDVAISFA